MEYLVVILVIVLLITLVWAFRLRNHTELLPVESPPAELFSPLFYAVAAVFDAGLVVIDADRQVQYLNQQAEEFLGARQGSALGQGLITLLRDHRIDTLAEDALHDGEAREAVLQPLLRGRTLRVRVAPLANEAFHGALLLIRDVTQISMLERARRDMVANVSHELRTPLASVKLLVETLQTAPPPAIAERMLGQVAQEVDSITQLVDELHELSQIESGRVVLQYELAPLAMVVARAIERIAPQVERKQVQIDARISEQLPLALIDSARIGQVLLNLLHNAMKFTPEGGAIRVEARPIRCTSGDLANQDLQLPAAHPDGEWLLVSVNDTGIGIPAQDLQRIFERFYKVDRARTRHAGGTGLGLAIARHLVEGHGGRIWATSTEGLGSTFYLTLPVSGT